MVTGRAAEERGMSDACSTSMTTRVRSHDLAVPARCLYPLPRRFTSSPRSNDASGTPSQGKAVTAGPRPLAAAGQLLPIMRHWRR